MSISITRSGDRYIATVTPPHGGETSWATPAPMTTDELIESLKSLGCHTTDIGDAFYAADPEWLKR